MDECGRAHGYYDEDDCEIIRMCARRCGWTRSFNVLFVPIGGSEWDWSVEGMRFDSVISISAVMMITFLYNLCTRLSEIVELERFYQ